MPVMSGCPSANRGSGPAGPRRGARVPRPRAGAGGAASCASAVPTVMANADTAASSGVIRFHMADLQLLLTGLLIGRSRSVGSRTAKYTAAIGQQHYARRRGVGFVLRPVAFDRDLIAGPERFFPPALPQQNRNGSQLKIPRGNLPIRFLHVHIEAGMGVHPFHFADGAANLDRF